MCAINMEETTLGVMNIAQIDAARFSRRPRFGYFSSLIGIQNRAILSHEKQWDSSDHRSPGGHDPGPQRMQPERHDRVRTGRHWRNCPAWAAEPSSLIGSSGARGGAIIESPGTILVLCAGNTRQ
jgi:hypothetical protein